MIREFAGRYPGCEAAADDLPISVRWISEPDRGLYDAMNKAWAMCTGDIVAVCNDRLCTTDAVTKLVRAIERGGEKCIGAHADLVYVEGERVVRTWHMGEGRIRDGWMPGHPTLFLKRQIYERYGTQVRHKNVRLYSSMNFLGWMHEIQGLYRHLNISGIVGHLHDRIFF